jgi:hypothetical protein
VAELEARAQLGLTAAYLLLAPALLALTAPLWIVWGIRQVRRKRREGWRCLFPYTAGTVANYAEAMIRKDPPGGGWLRVSRAVDDWIASTPSGRIWRVHGLILGMELAPLLALRLPFSQLTPEARRTFVDRHLTNPVLFLRLAGTGRQVVRLGYYSMPETHERLGFVPVDERRARPPAAPREDRPHGILERVG